MFNTFYLLHLFLLLKKLSLLYVVFVKNLNIKNASIGSKNLNMLWGVFFNYETLKPSQGSSINYVTPFWPKFDPLPPPFVMLKWPFYLPSDQGKA